MKRAIKLFCFFAEKSLYKLAEEEAFLANEKKRTVPALKNASRNCSQSGGNVSDSIPDLADTSDQLATLSNDTTALAVKLV